MEIFNLLTREMKWREWKEGGEEGEDRGKGKWQDKEKV